MPDMRPSTPADIPAIHSLIGTIYREYGFALNLEGVDAHLVDPGAYCRERGGEFWVVEERGMIFATVGVLLHEHAGELKSLYVSKSMRRGGWGRRLTESVVDYCRRAGKPRTILWSDSRFIEAHRLYGRLGFARTGERTLADDSVELGFERSI